MRAHCYSTLMRGHDRPILTNFPLSYKGALHGRVGQCSAQCEQAPPICSAQCVHYPVHDPMPRIAHVSPAVPLGRTKHDEESRQPRSHREATAFPVSRVGRYKPCGRHVRWAHLQVPINSVYVWGARCIFGRPSVDNSPCSRKACCFDIIILLSFGLGTTGI